MNLNISMYAGYFELVIIRPNPFLHHYFINCDKCYLIFYMLWKNAWNWAPFIQKLVFSRALRSAVAREIITSGVLVFPFSLATSISNFQLKSTKIPP